MIDEMVFRGYSIMGDVTCRESERISIHPSLFSDAVYISIPNNLQGVILKISGMDGRFAYSKKIISSEEIDLSFLEKGIYFYYFCDSHDIIKSGIILHE